MIKRIMIHTSIALALCGIFEVAGVLSHLDFFEKVFILALIYMLAGGYSFLRSAGYFAIQRYSFHKVASKLPFVSRLFLNANTRGADFDEEKETAKDFVDYKENYMEKTEISDCIPLLVTFVILTIISVGAGYLFG